MTLDRGIFTLSPYIAFLDWKTLPKMPLAVLESYKIMIRFFESVLFVWVASYERLWHLTIDPSDRHAFQGHRLFHLRWRERLSPFNRHISICQLSQAQIYLRTVPQNTTARPASSKICCQREHPSSHQTANKAYNARPEVNKARAALKRERRVAMTDEDRADQRAYHMNHAEYKKALDELTAGGKGTAKQSDIDALEKKFGKGKKEYRGAK